MHYRIIWAILALVMVIPANLAGQAIVKPPQTMCPACLAPVPEKKASPKPKVASKPVVRQSTPTVVARKADTTYVKTIGGVDSMVVTVQFDTLNVNFSGKIELELSDEDRIAMRESQNQIFDREGRHQRGWWSRNGGKVAAVAVIGTAIGVAGNHYGWWDRGKITQCTIVGSGTCPR